MKILFISQWFHPNQHPIVKALKNRGHEVKFICLNSPSRVHEYITPTVVDYSTLKRPVDKLIKSIGSNKKCTIPNIHNLYEEISSFNPDIAIIRNYYIYSMISIVLSKLKKTNIIIHDQWPVCRQKVSNKKRIFDQAYESLFDVPPIRISPVLGDCTEYLPAPNEYYLPFVYDPKYIKSLEEKNYLKNDVVNIIMVGKIHRKRKNHPDLLDAINNLSVKYDICLTIVGTLPKNKSDDWLRNEITKREMEGIVDIKQNLSYEHMQALYFEHDLFVLPSEHEPAAFSLLEAMAQALPVISSDDNGTKCYIEEGKNGFIFKTGDVFDLTKKIELVINSENNIKCMGEHSYQIVTSRHTPSMYCDLLTNIINREFG